MWRGLYFVCREARFSVQGALFSVVWATFRVEGAVFKCAGDSQDGTDPGPPERHKSWDYPGTVCSGRDLDHPVGIFSGAMKVRGQCAV